MTLVANDDADLFHDPGSSASGPKCASAARFGLFCVTNSTPEIVRFIGVVVCLLVIVGLVPCGSSIAYWYVAFSVFYNIVPIDGGDQLAASLSFLLVVICLRDWRLFAWLPPARMKTSALGGFCGAVWCLIPVQVAFVYFNSAIAKFSSPIWVEGSALWYWVQHPGFNASTTERRLGLDLLANTLLSAALAWGTIALELALGVVILFFSHARNIRVLGLIVGCLFHIVIALTIGLVSFGLAMTAALVLSLWRARDAVPWWYLRLVRRSIRQSPIDRRESPVA